MTNPVYGYSVTAHGFHPDSMALQLPFLWYLVLIYKRKAPTRSQFFVLGAMGGFAVYFAYISVFAVAAGVLPWLMLSLLKRTPRGRFRLAAFVGGGLVGAIPLWVYNVFNRLPSSFTDCDHNITPPTDLAAKVKFFQEHTMQELLHFSDPFDPQAAYLGVFEGAFWMVALAAVAMPLGYHLVCRLKRHPVESPWVGQYMDAVTPLFVLFTMAIFFNTRLPVGPAHLVPMLLILMVSITGRLCLLLKHGRLFCKAVAGLLIVGLMLAGLHQQLDGIKPSRLGSGLVMDGRNYSRFLFRYLEVISGRGLKLKERRARHLLLALPLELSLDNKDYIHADHASAFPGAPGTPVTTWGAVLGRYINEPPRTDIKLDKSASTGLALARLFQHKAPPTFRRHASLEQVMAFVARYDEAKAGTMLEVLGFNLGPRHDLLTPLRKHMAKKPVSVQRRLEQRVAFGMGRATFLPAYFESPKQWCNHEKLPQTLQSAYIKGLGHAVATRMISSVPKWADDNLCIKNRAMFWQGVKLARTPSHDKLAKTNQIRDLN